MGATGRVRRGTTPHSSCAAPSSVTSCGPSPNAGTTRTRSTGARRTACCCSGPPGCSAIRGVAPDRVLVVDLENAEATPIYVHAKVCVVDDVWFTCGSDNFNLRSWTSDSEITCAVVDETLDGREPADPTGRGDGARRLAR